MIDIRQMESLSVKALIHNQAALSADEEATMSFCLLVSQIVRVGIVDGKLACIWGLVPPTLLSNRAYLWLYVTDIVKDHQFMLIRKSQLEIEKILNEYDTIVGHCHLHAHKSIRWLKWLGAEFQEAQGMRLPFMIRKKIDD